MNRPWSALMYAVALIFCGFFTFHTLKLDHFRLSVPLIYGGDGVYYQSMINTIAETGWYQHNDRLGLPGGQDYRDFPVSDGWFHYAIIRVLAIFTSNPMQLWNLFYLSTFPLITTVTLFVLRRLGLSPIVAVTVSLLYTFLPFHLMRMNHLFFASYYAVPPAVLALIRLDQGVLPFVPGSWKLSLKYGLTGIIIGMCGVYFAFFTIFLGVITATLRAVSVRRVLPLWSGGVFVACIGLGTILTLVPSIEYKLTSPTNAETTTRHPLDAEIYGLKVVQILLPVPFHRVYALRSLREFYACSGVPLINENETAALGLIGSVGFLALVVVLLLKTEQSPLKLLARLNFCALLLATIGGFGSIVSYLGFSWIRAYNRISIFIGFFALLTIAILLQKLLDRYGTTPLRRGVFGMVCLLLLGAGVFDQTSPGMFPPYIRNRIEIRDDQEFARNLETAIPEGGAIFQLPHCDFPEGQYLPGFNSYDMYRPALHTRKFGFSFGSLRGHPSDIWCRNTSRQPVPEVLHKLACTGWKGIYIDRYGYHDHARALEAELKDHLGEPLFTSRNQRMAFYDLRAYTQCLRGSRSEEEWATETLEASKPILPFYGKGFHREEGISEFRVYHWSSPVSEMHLENRRDDTVRVKLDLLFDLPGRLTPARLQIAGPLHQGEYRIDPPGQSIRLEFDLPPGRHPLQFRCDAPILDKLRDPMKRELCFKIEIQSLRELPATVPMDRSAWKDH